MTSRERAIVVWSRGDPLVAWMIGNGIEVTRENYLDCAYIGLPMPEWTAELESELPDFLQLGTG